MTESKMHTHMEEHAKGSSNGYLYTIEAVPSNPNHSYYDTYHRYVTAHDEQVKKFFESIGFTTKGRLDHMYDVASDLEDKMYIVFLIKSLDIPNEQALCVGKRPPYWGGLEA